MLSLWSLMHGTAMLLIRGEVAGPLCTQMIHSCLDALEAIITQAARSKGKACSGPKWPASLILGEAAHSNVNIGEVDSSAKSATRRFNQSKPKPAARLRAVHSDG
jgi:hypothetical protein